MTQWNFFRFGFCAAFVLSMATVTARADDTRDQPSKPAPKGAMLLFDGKNLDGWENMSRRAAPWPVEDGYMQVKPGTGDIRTKRKFGTDYDLHVEFWLPLMPDAHDQARANSGVYLNGNYEVQVLDSYHNDTYANGSVGALYGLITPDKDAQAKAIRPPEQWQTYDITFHAPKVNGQGAVVTKGRLTVVLNGVAIIKDGEFDKVTGGAMTDKVNAPGPLRLQDHGCKVRYRNIWLKPSEDLQRDK